MGGQGWTGCYLGRLVIIMEFGDFSSGFLLSYIHDRVAPKESTIEFAVKDHRVSVIIE